MILDSAIPSFEVDGQSISPTEEVFPLRPLPGSGLKEINDRLLEYQERVPFIFGKDQVFGAASADSLKKITGIDDITERIEKARREVCQDFAERRDGRLFNGRKLGLRNFNFDRVGDNERSRLDFRVFETDYFTHAVMQKVYKNT